ELRAPRSRRRGLLGIDLHDALVGIPTVELADHAHRQLALNGELGSLATWHSRSADHLAPLWSSTPPCDTPADAFPCVAAAASGPHRPTGRQTCTRDLWAELFATRGDHLVDPY